MRLKKQSIILIVLLIIFSFSSNAYAVDTVASSDNITESIEIEESISIEDEQDQNILAAPEKSLSNASNNYREICLDEPLNLDADGDNFYFTVKKSGNYQLWLDVNSDTTEFEFTMISQDENNMIISVNDSQGFYKNCYLRAGYSYYFNTNGCLSVTIKNKDIPTLSLDRAIKTDTSAQKLFVFAPLESGKYNFSIEKYNIAETGGLDIYLDKYDDRPYGGYNNEAEKIVYLDAGEKCYVNVANTSLLRVSKKSNAADLNISEIWLLKDPFSITDTDGYVLYPHNTRFVNSGDEWIGNTEIDKPFFTIVLDSDLLNPILLNSNGDVIKWKIHTKSIRGKTIFSLPMNVLHSYRVFTIVLSTKNLSKEFTIAINPTKNKPDRTNITAINKNGNQTIVHWKKISNADGYYIYCSKQKEGDYKKVATVNDKSKNQYVTEFKYNSFYYKIVSFKKSYGLTIRGYSSYPKRYSGHVKTLPPA